MGGSGPITEQMMAALLPDQQHLKSICEPFGVDLVHDTEAAASLNGDLWDLRMVGEKRLAFYLADCSGIEIEAALNAVRTKTLIDDLTTEWHDPAFFLFDINNRLCDTLLVGQYVTMVLGIIDFANDTFTYAAAGMPPPLIIEASTKSLQLGDGSGLPLGATKNATFQNRVLPFVVGNRLILHTDGLNESITESGKRLGLKGVIATIKEILAKEGQVDDEELLSVMRGCAEQDRDNDYTTLLCHRKEPWLAKSEMDHTVIKANKNKTILVADDEELARELLVFALSSEGYVVDEAEDGLQALDLLNKAPNRYDSILLDKNMPHMDGFDVLREIKKNAVLSNIPVIIQTGASSADEINEGIKAGAYHYLTKPFNIDVMLAIVRVAIAEKTMYAELEEETRHKESVIEHMTSGAFELRTIQEVHDITAMLALACPDPQAAVVGLVELLLNAVEHGNLGITYNEKTELVNSGRWEAEVLRRLELPEHANKVVRVEFSRSEEQISFHIKDQGAGFNWQSYLDFDPARVTHPHGRGIAMASMITFSEVTYLGNGNEVIARINAPA